MSDSPRLAPEVDPSRIHESATITGQTLIEGARSAVGEGARIENSYLRNVIVEPGAVIVDSVIVAEEDAGQHVPGGFAAKWAIRGTFPAVIGAGTTVSHCTMKCSSAGAGSVCSRSFIGNSTIGEHNTVEDIYGQTVFSGAHAVMTGPTEICDVWLGHHGVIDRCGFFEGAFTNDLYVVEFDKAKTELVVKETIDIPHASRYGLNTINSTNSGNLKDQPDGMLKSLGPHKGLWRDSLLSHESIVMGPCCWVKGWTKVIGKSAQTHETADSMLMDLLYTNLLPFSVSGMDGASVTGQVVPGELFNSLAYKQRQAAWAFTYAPGAVIDMVQRVANLSGDTALADRVVELSLRSALALVYFNAAQRGADLDGEFKRIPKGWKGWLIGAKNTLEQHLESGLWQFSGGEPVNWRREGDTWVPAKPELLTAIAEDALDARVEEPGLIECDMPVLDRTLGVLPEELERANVETSIDPGATVSPKAFVGPGVTITEGSVVGDGAWLCRTVVDKSTVASGARLSRCSLRNATVGSDAQVVSSVLHDAVLASGSGCTCARLEDAELAGKARVSPYAWVQRSSIAEPCIVGSNISDTKVDTTFMSFHMPGQVEHLIAEPSYVDQDGERVPVKAIPMLGGGLRVLGTEEQPVRMPCAFIGSNAILEPGTYVGFGSFVLGRLTTPEGLPPFTVSTMAGPERDEIGMVVHKFANVAITHFVSWAFQALGPDEAARVGLLMPSYLREGAEAMKWAQAQREAGTFDESSPFAKYSSLKLYTEDQLKNGLESYESALADGRWDMVFENGELRFCGNGAWNVRGGVGRWEPGE